MSLFAAGNTQRASVARVEPSALVKKPLMPRLKSKPLEFKVMGWRALNVFFKKIQNNPLFVCKALYDMTAMDGK